MEESIDNNIEKKSVVLDLCVKEDGFEFASSIASALSEAENKHLVIEEKITVNQTDKLRAVEMTKI